MHRAISCSPPALEKHSPSLSLSLTCTLSHVPSMREHLESPCGHTCVVTSVPAHTLWIHSPILLRAIDQGWLSDYRNGFVPGCGSGYDVLHLSRVLPEGAVGLDVAELAVEKFKRVCPSSPFPPTHCWMCDRYRFLSGFHVF